MPAGQLWNIYRTTGNLGATQWLWNLQSFGVLAVTATVLMLQGDVLRLAAWSAAPLILVTSGALISLKRSHPELLPKLSEVSLAGLRELLKPSLLFGLIMLSMALTLQGPVFASVQGVRPAQRLPCWSLPAHYPTSSDKWCRHYNSPFGLSSRVSTQLGPAGAPLWPPVTSDWLSRIERCRGWRTLV